MPWGDIHLPSTAASGNKEAEKAGAKEDDGVEPTDAPSELPVEKAFWHIFACATLWGFHVAQGQHGSYKISRVKLAYGCLAYVLQLSFIAVFAIWLYNNGELCLDKYKSIVMLMPIYVGCMFTVYAQGLLLWNAKGMAKYMENIYQGGLRAPRNRQFAAWLLVAAVVCIVDSSVIVFLVFAPSVCRGSFLIPIVTNGLFAFVFDLYMCSFVYTLRIAYEKLNCRIKQVGVWSVAEVQEVGRTWLRLSRLLDEHNQAFQYLLHGRFSIFLAEIMCVLYSLVTLPHSKQQPLGLIIPLMESLALAIALNLVGEKLKQTQESIIVNLCYVMLNLSHTVDLLPCKIRDKLQVKTSLPQHLAVSKPNLKPSITIFRETQVNTWSRQAMKLSDGLSPDNEKGKGEDTEGKHDQDVELKRGEASESKLRRKTEVEESEKDPDEFDDVRDTDMTGHGEKRKGNITNLAGEEVKAQNGLKGEVEPDQGIRMTDGKKQRMNDCGMQCGCCQRELSEVIARMEARPATVKIWGQASLGWESFVYLAGLVMTYLVVLLQLRPNSVP